MSKNIYNAYGGVVAPHWRDYARAHRHTPHDRFGAVDPPQNFVKNPGSDFTFVPKVGGVQVQYQHIVDSTAKRLAALDRPLTVYWSGGIDSTVVLIALIKQGVQTIEVAMNEKSIIENGDFYRGYIQGKLKTVDPIDVPTKLLTTAENVIVTGELNDQLFGSDAMLRVIFSSGYDVLLGPLSEDVYAAAMCKANASISDAHVRLIYADILASAATQNVPLRTVFDAMWWANFAFKWQCVLTRMYMYAPISATNSLTDAHRSRLHHFFGGTDFQQWACERIEPKILTRWGDYKITAKRYIYRFDGNEDYLIHGVKVVSLRDLGNGNRPTRILSDMTVE